MSSTPTDATFAVLVDGQTHYASSLTELVAELIPGYSEDHDQALEQRWRLAVVRTDALQADLAVAAVDRDPDLLERLDEPAITALFTSRAVEFEVPSVWRYALPLVLLATDFEPYTQRQRPDGNVRWVDPADERSLLVSLAAAGDLGFYTREEVA